jgi:hypothetical protein
MQRHVVQDDFSEGMVRDVAPSLISESGCYDLVDALLDEDGNPYLRGGTEYHSKEGLGTSGLTWITDVYLAPGRRTVFANNSDFGVLGSDDESVVNLGGAGLTTPKQSAVLKDLLYIGGGSIYAGSRKSAVYSTGKAHVTKGSKTVEGESSTAWAANVDPGMLFQIGAERVYIVDEVLSDTKLILRDAYEGTSGTLKSYSLSPVYTVGADPYEVSDYVTVCENRLVMLIGHKVIFTEVNNPHSITNQFSTTNEHTLPEGVEGIGLTTAGQTVIIFTTAGVWALDGLALDIVDSVGNPQHRLQRISPEVVLAGASGLAGSEQRIVVPAADGIYLMDGISQPVRISRPIDRLYQRRIIAGYRLGRAVVYRGHYFLPLVDGEGNVRDLFVCRLDRPTHSRRQGGFPWSRLTGDGGEMAAFAVRAETTAAEPVLLGAQAREPSRVIDCSTYFEPGAEHETDADESLIGFDLVTRDIPTGNEIANVVRSLWLRYELVNGGGNPIVKVYWSDGSLEGGEAEWDEVSWDEFNWAEDETGVTFQGVLRDGPPSDGREHEKFRVNQRMGFGRFRVRTFGRTPFFSLRLLQVNLRPSGAVR